jgi:hypothetical protein
VQKRVFLFIYYRGLKNAEQRLKHPGIELCLKIGTNFFNFMITIDRTEYKGSSWKKEVTNALKEGSNVTLKNFRHDSDINHSKEIGKMHRAKVSLHLDYTVCCFKILNKANHRKIG